jgi:HlyD family secretion protein
MNAKAALELAKLTADRKKKLAADHTVAQADFDSAMAALRQAEAQVQIKQAYLERTKVDLDHCTIYSPVDGIVISRAVDVGQTVAASMNAPVLFTIANDLRNMQIDANVAEGDVGSVEVGQNVDFNVDAYPYRTFHGKVTQIRNAPLNVQNVVSYDTVISVNNADLKLKPGMTANVMINIAQRENALKIPNAALRFRLPEDSKKTASMKKPAQPTPPTNPDSAAKATERRAQPGASKPARTIYVLEGDSQKPIPVQIKVGIGDGVSTEVTEGLKENQRVVTGYAQAQDAPNKPVANPFGGGMRRF